jgi:glycosyltransferase involved in cell wall biosynthesis
MTPEAGVDVSIIIPTYDAGGTLAACLRSVLEQRFAGTYEVILVSSSDGSDAHPSVEEHPRLRVVRIDRRTPAAVARNRGVEIAAGRAYAFTDADAVADPGWLEALVEASRDGDVAVGGAVINGTPESLLGSTEYLLEFSDQHPARPPAGAWHAATVNFFLPESLWTKYGPWPEDMGGGEDTWMSIRLRADGRFAFAPGAAVTHLNRTRLTEVVRRQYRQGRHAAEIGRRVAHRFRPLLRYPVLAPIAVLARVFTAYRRVSGWAPELWPVVLWGLPVMLASLVAWGIGLATHGTRLDVRSYTERRYRRRETPEHPDR